MTFGGISGVHLIMAASAYIHNDKTYMEVAASNIYIKIHHQFSKQRTIEQWKFSGELTKQI